MPPIWTPASVTPEGTTPDAVVVVVVVAGGGVVVVGVVVVTGGVSASTVAANAPAASKATERNAKRFTCSEDPLGRSLDRR